MNDLRDTLHLRKECASYPELDSPSPDNYIPILNRIVSALNNDFPIAGGPDPVKVDLGIPNPEDVQTGEDDNTVVPMMADTSIKSTKPIAKQVECVRETLIIGTQDSDWVQNSFILSRLTDEMKAKAAELVRKTGSSMPNPKEMVDVPNSFKTVLETISSEVIQGIFETSTTGRERRSRAVIGRTIQCPSPPRGMRLMRLITRLDIVHNEAWSDEEQGHHEPSFSWEPMVNTLVRLYSSTGITSDNNRSEEISILCENVYKDPEEPTIVQCVATQDSTLQALHELIIGPTIKNKPYTSQVYYMVLEPSLRDQSPPTTLSKLTSSAKNPMIGVISANTARRPLFATAICC
ncbi:hypothetical protein M231_06082 [Tremella mesenterica]|uniref:Uncharacterized protein n=1 Tax=Tremella mesenterica TaxID=5217 RepID=A0A4Q1BCQ4_TREME|nr:hypothetical protein M231_06082 [Tremella mesenterica]